MLSKKNNIRNQEHNHGVIQQVIIAHAPVEFSCSKVPPIPNYAVESLPSMNHALGRHASPSQGFSASLLQATQLHPRKFRMKKFVCLLLNVVAQSFHYIVDSHFTQNVIFFISPEITSSRGTPFNTTFLTQTRYRYCTKAQPSSN